MTAWASCRQGLMPWLEQKSQSPSQLWPAMKRTPPGASFYYRKGTTRTTTWTLGPALRRPLSRQRRPSTASSKGKAVWQAFECENLGDFHDIYLKTDVLLLADVFENFRKTCLKHYKLDPAHYYTSPGLSWDALLKYTGINLELLTDVNKHLFVERGLRGGKQPLPKRLQPPGGDELHYVLRREQSLRLGHESASPGWQFRMVFCFSNASPNQEVEAKQKDRLHSRGRSRVPRGAARRSQRLSPCPIKGPWLRGSRRTRQRSCC